MAILDRLIEPSSSMSNDFVEEWRARGGKVIGYFCSYVPEEIIHAAGILAVRIRATGRSETEDGDAYLSNYNCTFTRHVLDLVLKDKFDFLEDIVALNSCDQIRRLFDIIEQKAPRPFMQFLNVPHTAGDGARKWYMNEISSFRRNLEKHFGVEIDDDKLNGSIRLLPEDPQIVGAIGAAVLARERCEKLSVEK